MKRNIYLLFTFGIVLIFGAVTVSAQFDQIKNKIKGNASQSGQKSASETNPTAQAKSEPYWFFAKPALAKRKIIPVGELKACMLGDVGKPSVSGKFKEEITSTPGNQARLLDSGMCDVALAFDTRPDGFERVKKDHAGFAIYKISGTSLELAAEPGAGGWIAVGRMALASESSLNKQDITGCGDAPLRDVFRPKTKIWKNWMQKYVKFEDLKTPQQLEQENVLLYGCDVWIFTPEDYERFAKKYGAKYPLFDVSPDEAVLTKRK